MTSFLLAAVLLAATNTPPATLDLPQTLDIALRQNPAILKAQAEIRRTHGLQLVASSARLPQLALTGQYTQRDPDSIDRFPFGGTNAAPVEFKNQERPWNVQIEATQILYNGGKTSADRRAARHTQQAAIADFQRVVADTVRDVRQNFYAILLAEQLVVVREQSVTLLDRQLTDTRHRFESGTIPKFDVLRAEVELANARPPLIRAQNVLRLARETILKLLALDTTSDFTTVQFTGTLQADPIEIQLPNALTNALTRRPEIKVAHHTTGITQAQIQSAQAGNRPELSLFTGWQVYDSTFGNDLDQTVDGWFAGARLRWNLFDGQLTKGQVIQAQARHRRAQLDQDETQRTIQLEVRQAYSDLLTARELLTAQQKTVESAEESLRLAQARYTAGTSTQLEVLSAQTALTEARSNEIQARYDFNVARNKLDHATGENAQLKP